MLSIVDKLKVAVFLDNPTALFANEWSNNCGGVLVVVVGSINIANVMQQRCNDLIVVGTGPPSPCCSLKRVAKAGYLVA
jgi:hypothetical protein